MSGHIQVGPPTDSRPGVLRSIANSVEPLFPDAADQLRGIAFSLDDLSATEAES